MPKGRIAALIVGLTVSVFCLSVTDRSALAESYVAGQLGLTFPQALKNGDVTQDGFGSLSLSDQELKNSIMVGAKLGHYFSRMRWLGIETGLSFANPHLKQGNVTFTSGSGSATVFLPGVYQRMIIWDMATLMVRYPRYRLQPYAGVGPALFFGHLQGPTDAPGQSATNIGLNVEGGARYYMTRRWALFGELQYHLARMSYSSNDNNPAADPFAFRATYSALTFSVGLSYQF